MSDHRARDRRAARAAARRGDWAEGAKFYERVVMGADRQPTDYIQLGHAHKEMGDYAKAEWHYRKAIDIDPMCAEAYRQLGHLLRRCHRGGEAVETFTTLLVLDPTDDEARDFVQHTGRSEAALEESMIAACGRLSRRRASQGRRPTPIDILLPIRRARARSAARRGAWDTAARRYAAILARDPDRPLLQIQYGHALKQSGALRKAEQAYRRALILSPDDSTILVQLGHLFKLMEAPAAARCAYRAAEAHNKRFFEGIEEPVEPAEPIAAPAAEPVFVVPPRALSPRSAALLRQLQLAAR